MMIKLAGKRTIASLLALLLPTWASGQEWVRFRGPNGSGVSTTAVPTSWTADQLDWSTELPGIGHSSPVVWGDRIFLMSGHETQATQYVVAIDINTGKILWQREFPLEAYTIHARNSFASSTPTVDERHVYVAWSSEAETTLTALDHDGETVWQQVFHRPFDSQHGFGCSPILFEELVILSVMQKKPDRNGPRVQRSNVVACRRDTGELVWDTQLSSDSVSYSVPCIREREGQPAEIILCSTSHGIFSLNPADGKMNWSVDVFDKRTVSSPVLVGDLIFGSTGSGGGGNYVVAVRAEPEASLAYEIRAKAPYVPTPVAKAGLVFLWSDKGIVTCIEAESGNTVWQKRVEGDYSGSPIIAGDHLYCIDEDGVVTVLAAAETFELVSRNPLGEPSRSTPAVANGRLLLRTYSHLISVGG